MMYSHIRPVVPKENVTTSREAKEREKDLRWKHSQVKTKMIETQM